MPAAASADDDSTLGLTTPSPSVSEAEAERIANRHYGITATAHRLAGEKDENFRLRGDGPQLFLKIAHANEPESITDLVTAAHLHLAEVAPELPVQRVVPAMGGEPLLTFRTEAGDLRRTRVVTFLDGHLLKSVPPSPQLGQSLGRILAQLGRALRTFEHQATDRKLLWDVWQAGGATSMLGDVRDPATRDVLRECLERFTGSIRPRLETMRRQVVHNDFSTDNVLIADDRVTVSGILDFGDMVSTQLINDVAVAAAGQVGDGPDPFAPVIELVRGYHEVIALEPPELELLYELVRVRLAMHLAITGWRAARFPDNKEYLLRKTAHAWAQLQRLPPSAESETTRRLLDACHETRKA